LSLQSRGKLNHITGQITTKPTQLSGTAEPVPEGETPTTKTVVPVPNTSTDTSYQHWHQDDITVINWLLNSMEPQVSRLFMYCDTAKELWNETKEMFGQDQNFAYIFHLKQEIAKIQQGSKTVTEYYGDLKTKWDELALYTQTTDLKTLEQEHIFQFLSGLDPNYDSVRSQILLSKELPKSRAVVAMVQREESRRKLMNPQVTSEPESQAFATTNRHRDASSGTRGASSTRCDNYKKEGHVRSGCWFLYPELRPKHRDKGGDRKGS
jgi:gag-polypeptide of LTR copia-type